MSARAIGALALCALPLAGAPWAGGGAASAEPRIVPELGERERRLALALSPLPPVPPDPTNRFADDPRAARLGRQLFFDPGLSARGDIACSTCHDPALELSDGKALAEGLARASRRSPSLWNVAHQRWLFWDGRADSLWAQAVQPIESEVEMGGDRVALAHHIARQPELARAYQELFGPLPALHEAERFPARAKPMPEQREDPRHRAWLAMGEEDRAAATAVLVNAAKAIAAFERLLVKEDAPFDRFVRGLRTGEAEDLGALPPSAQRGLALFLGKARCRTCHSGPLFSDGEFHDLSLPVPAGESRRDAGRYEGLRRLLDDPFSGAGEHADGGREEARARIAELGRGSELWGEFRTPSLRNLGPGPFMHAGQLGSLREVLRFYSTREGAAPAHAHRELVLEPLQLTEGELDELEAFLRSLQGRPRHPELLQPAGKEARPR